MEGEKIFVAVKALPKITKQGKNERERMPTV